MFLTALVSVLKPLDERRPLWAAKPTATILTIRLADPTVITNCITYPNTFEQTSKTLES